MALITQQSVVVPFSASWGYVPRFHNVVCTSRALTKEEGNSAQFVKVTRKQMPHLEDLYGKDWNQDQKYPGSLTWSSSTDEYPQIHLLPPEENQGVGVFETLSTEEQYLANYGVKYRASTASEMMIAPDATLRRQILENNMHMALDELVFMELLNATGHLKYVLNSGWVQYGKEDVPDKQAFIAQKAYTMTAPETRYEGEYYWYGFTGQKKKEQEEETITGVIDATVLQLPSLIERFASQGIMGFPHLNGFYVLYCNDVAFRNICYTYYSNHFSSYELDEKKIRSEAVADVIGTIGGLFYNGVIILPMGPIQGSYLGLNDALRAQWDTNVVAMILVGYPGVCEVVGVKPTLIEGEAQSLGRTREYGWTATLAHNSCCRLVGGKNKPSGYELLPTGHIMKMMWGTTADPQAEKLGLGKSNKKNVK